MQCTEYAYHYINRFPKTEKELYIQLVKKGYNHYEAIEAIKELKSKGYIDDQQFAKLYIESECIRKGKPIIYIKGKLLSKGIDKHLLQDTIDKLYDQMHEGIISAISRHIDSYKAKGLEGQDIIGKVIARGYNISDIKLCIQNRNAQDE